MKHFDRIVISVFLLFPLNFIEHEANAGEMPSSAEAFPTRAAEGGASSGLPRFGIGVNASLLGIGVQAATALSRKTNIRGGVNVFKYNRNLSKDGIDYAGKLDFRSAELLLDWFPFGGGFHLSPGALIYNGNKVTATGTVAAGNNFSLGSTNYTSNPANPVRGDAKLDFKKAAPMFLFGWGNLLPRSGRHFTVSFELGAAFQGEPKTSLNLNGSACLARTCLDASADPRILADVHAQQDKINHDLRTIKIWPVISLGFGWSF